MDLKGEHPALPDVVRVYTTPAEPVLRFTPYVRPVVTNTTCAQQELLAGYKVTKNRRNRQGHFWKTV